MRPADPTDGATASGSFGGRRGAGHLHRADRRDPLPAGGRGRAGPGRCRSRIGSREPPGWPRRSPRHCSPARSRSRSSATTADLRATAWRLAPPGAVIVAGAAGRGRAAAARRPAADQRRGHRVCLPRLRLRPPGDRARTRWPGSCKITLAGTLAHHGQPHWPPHCRHGWRWPTSPHDPPSRDRARAVAARARRLAGRRRRAGRADVQIGSHTDLDALRRFAKGCEVVTFDHEHVPSAHIQALEAEGVNVAPGSAALLFAQDKGAMRERLSALGAPTPRWARVRTPTTWRPSPAASWPIVLKATTGGYDGKGVWMCRQRRRRRPTVVASGVDLIAEERVNAAPRAGRDGGPVAVRSGGRLSGGGNRAGRTASASR